MGGRTGERKLFTVLVERLIRYVSDGQISSEERMVTCMGEQEGGRVSEWAGKRVTDRVSG
jgi:hypothetical protein